MSLHLVHDSWSPAQSREPDAPPLARQLIECAAHVAAIGRHQNIDIHDSPPDLLAWAESQMGGVRHDHVATDSHPAFHAIVVRLHGVTVSLFSTMRGGR